MLEMGDAATDNEERREGDLPMVSRGIIESCNTHSVRPLSAVAIIAFAVKRRFAACDFT